MLNHITIMGRLVRNPEMRYTSTGTAVANFTLAVDRDFGGRDGVERETDFIDCVSFGKTAEFVNNYFEKGRMAVVDGRLQLRKWTDKNENKRVSAEVITNSCYFGDSKRDSANDAPPKAYYDEPVKDEYAELGEDDDFPF